MQAGASPWRSKALQENCQADSERGYTIIEISDQVSDEEGVALEQLEMQSK